MIPQTYVFGAEDYEISAEFSGVKWWVERDEDGLPYVAYKFIRKTDRTPVNQGLDAQS